VSSRLYDINNVISRDKYNTICLEKLYSASSGFDEFYKDFIEVALSFTKYSDIDGVLDYTAKDDKGNPYYQRNLIVISMNQNGSYDNGPEYYKNVDTFEK
jgi:hypothetical protein